MERLFKISIFFILVAALISPAINISYCEDAAVEIKTFRGTVEEIDWVGSLLTVTGMDDVTFLVPPGTKIIYGTETISLSDLEISDYVVVRYIDDPSGGPKAVSITVDKSYPIF